MAATQPPRHPPSLARDVAPPPAPEGGASVVDPDWAIAAPRRPGCADEVGIYNAAINDHELSLMSDTGCTVESESSYRRARVGPACLILKHL